MRGVLWITGLSGAGKTTLARRVVDLLRDDGVWVVHVDGDVMRELFGNDLGHAPADRRTNAWRMARTAAFLAKEGAFVVCSTVSMFEEVWAHNRENVAPYLEVLLDVPLPVLAARDPKGIYRAGKNVVGVDIDAAWPDAHLVLANATDADLERNVTTLHARALAMIGRTSTRRSA